MEIITVRITDMMWFLWGLGLMFTWGVLYFQLLSDRTPYSHRVFLFVVAIPLWPFGLGLMLEEHLRNLDHR